MSRIYGTAKVCPFDKQVCDLATEGLNLDPGIAYRDFLYTKNAGFIFYRT